MNNEKKYILGLTLAELKQVAKDLGMPAFTGGQMAKWLYQQHVKSIDEMTNISKANRAKLGGSRRSASRRCSPVSTITATPF